MEHTKTGTLFLIPTLLGQSDPTAVLPAGTLSVIRKLDFYIVENVRTARRFLGKAGTEKAIPNLTFVVLDKHQGNEDIATMLAPALAGIDIGLMSEAGSPCIADPGNTIVEAAHKLNIKVVPLTGPNSILLALMASGFNGQQFVFHGYLPVKPDERQERLRTIEGRSRVDGETQIFIETPYRNRQLFDAILKTCQPATMMCIAVNLSIEDEEIRSMTIAQWKKKTVHFDKKPAVFLLWHPGPYAKR